LREVKTGWSVAAECFAGRAKVKASMKVPLAICALIFALFVGAAHAAVSGFVEDFDGDGRYEGFDNPGWTIRNLDANFEDGGLRIVKEWGDFSNTTFTREILGRGSFTTTLEFRDLDFENLEQDETFSKAAIGFSQRLNPVPGEFDLILVVLSEIDLTGPGEWWLNVINVVWL
jgi:hypothetical protein